MTKCRKCKEEFFVNFDGECMECGDSVANCKLCSSSRICIEC